MSTFQVPVAVIDAIEPHPNANALEIAVIQRYRSVVRKVDGFKAGDKVVYMPMASIVPEYLLRRMGLWSDETGAGLLGGANSDRVSAIKLRGVLSQGICMRLPYRDEEGIDVWVTNEKEMLAANVGDDVAEFLGVRKWSPPIPPELRGEVFEVSQELIVDFDIEDIKAYPDAMIVGEEVEYTEKMHGVFTAVTVVPLDVAKSSGITEFGFGREGNILVYSKGSRRLVFRNCAKNAASVYVRSTRDLVTRLQDVAVDIREPLTVLGETYGRGVQDLNYGKKLGYKMFGACQGYRGQLDHFDPERRAKLAAALGVEQVHCFYRGPFSWETLAEHTDGKTSEDANHIREGVIVTPVVERSHFRLGRVIAKSVSEKYLLRSGGTEYS